MRIITPRLLVALLTFVIGITAFSFKSILWRPARKTNEARPVLINSSPAIDNTAANNSDQSKADTETQIIKDLDIIPVNVKEENTRSLFKIDIEYPQIKRPGTSQQRKFNKYVKSLFTGDIQSFKAFCSKNRKYPNGKQRDMEYFLGVHYEVLYVDKNLISVKITEESFTGYLNSNYSLVSINYDLRNGRLLNLSDLFIPKVNHLKVASELCIKELEKRDLSCSGKSGALKNSEGALAGMREGASPKTENYQHWNITPNGIKVTFGEYQIGPGCLGLIDVDIPYNLLKERLSKRSPLNALVNLK